MSQINDTICAISTAPGVGGIAVARISGPQAIAVVSKLWRGKPLNEIETHTAHLGTIVDSDGTPLDQAVLVLYRAPGSYTGEDTIELSVHGSRYVQRRLLQLLIEAGARLAEAGEYTRRAFAAGNLDLAQAEAVADVIASNSRAAHRIALTQMRGQYSRRLAHLRQKLVDLAALLELELDFSEEEVEFASRIQLKQTAEEIRVEVSRLLASFQSGQAIKDGIPVAIVGLTNAGKSSLLNALLGDERAIVSNIPGTTRDTIEETLEIGEYLFRFIDTAGLRDTADSIEQIGIDRTRQSIAKARIVIVVADSTQPFPAELLDQTAHNAYRIIALNKIDLTEHPNLPNVDAGKIVKISARTHSGLDTLRNALQNIADQESGQADEGVLVTNQRHAQALDHALKSIDRMIDGMNADLPSDLVAQDLRETLHHLGTITGTITTPDILNTIFSRFCIGK